MPESKDARPSSQSRRGPSRESVPSDTDPVIARAANVIGGPLGRYAAMSRRPLGGTGARRHVPVPRWRPIAAALAACASLFVALGVVQKSYCFNHGWGGGEVFWHACYSDLPRVYVASGLVNGSFPYGPDSDGIAVPVGTGVVWWAISQFVPAGPDSTSWFVGLWAVVAAGLAAVLVVVTVLTCRRTPWQAAHIALSPLLITLVLISGDLLGVVLVSVGLLLWSRERPLWAGVLLGAATASRSYAVFAVIVLFVIALRAGRGRAATQMAGATLLTWSVILMLAAIPAGTAVIAPYRTWLGAGAEFGAPAYLPELLGHPLPLGALTALAITGWILAILAGMAATFLPAHRPRVAEVLIVVLVVVLLTSKAIPVQSSLWLVPLIALAGLRWRDHLPWVACELLYFMAVWLYLGGRVDPLRALPDQWYAGFLLLRCAGLTWLAVAAVRQAIARPAAPPMLSDDPLATAAEDPDEVAGPAAGRPDALVVTFS
ncbi:MAG: glycosyltransferase 87 family protein [Micrococcales bacterium]|nr:glycosyltransferase 87 family protein [Micrococcales bacterium]